ncbi:MAG: 5'-nucleotidase C-terminal domain-containing protein [Myxococcota bacterium]
MRRPHRILLLASALSTASLVACSSSEVTDGGALPDSGVHPDATSVPDSGEHPDAAPGDTGEQPDTGVQPDSGTGMDATVADAAVARSMVFIHTNDEHSHELGFAPEIDDFPTAAAPGSGIVGGVKRRGAVIGSLKAAAAQAGDPFALVSSGDEMMGSFFHFADASRGLDYAIATFLGYDVMTLGNHEFDFGAKALAGALSTGGVDATGTPGIMRVPIVTSNIHFSMSGMGDDELAALYSVAGDTTHPLRHSFVRTFGNVKVGFLGLLGMEASLDAPFKTPVHFSLATNTSTCTADSACPGSVCLSPTADPTATVGHCAVSTDESDVATHFPALVADTAAAVAELRAQGVDLVVALSHVGVNDREINTILAMGMPANVATASEEIVLAKAVEAALGASNVKGLDVIIGGHSHTALMSPLVVTYPGSAHATYVVQAGSYGRFVGQLKLTQSDPGSEWQLDNAGSHLVPVDDHVDTSGLDLFFSLAIDTTLNGLINGLESTPAAVAGDMLIFPGEQCDGSELPNHGQCSGLIRDASGGTFTCFANRQIDTSGCVYNFDSNCGDGVASGGEYCDAADLQGTTCAALGYSGGNLACNSNCSFDTSGCTPIFPSILEIVVNFAQRFRIHDDPAVTGDLFFYPVGNTSFDIPDATPSNESSLMNLVTDAERYAENLLIPSNVEDPVRISFNANGLLRDGIYKGRTGAISLSDLFRVLPLGISPLEQTPGYTLIDFWLAPQEIVAGLEIGVGQGVVSDSFWLGVSGAQVEYDLSRPAFDPMNPGTTGRVMRVTLTSTNAGTLGEGPLEGTPLFDRSIGFPNPTRMIHVSTSLYIGLFLDNLGICLRDAAGIPSPACAPCRDDSPCAGIVGSTCDLTKHRCVAPVPAPLTARSLMPDNSAELKEFLALMVYIRDQDGPVPTIYSDPTPRRLCCVGSGCPADNSRSCPR